MHLGTVASSKHILNNNDIFFPFHILTQRRWWVWFVIWYLLPSLLLCIRYPTVVLYEFVLTKHLELLSPDVFMYCSVLHALTDSVIKCFRRTMSTCHSCSYFLSPVFAICRRQCARRQIRIKLLSSPFGLPVIAFLIRSKHSRELWRTLSGISMGSNSITLYRSPRNYFLCVCFYFTVESVHSNATLIKLSIYHVINLRAHTIGDKYQEPMFHQWKQA